MPSSLSGLSQQQRDRLLRAQPGTRRSADGATSSRLRHAPQATAPVPTGLVALGLLTRSLQARLALSGPAIAGSIQAFPKACIA